MEYITKWNTNLFWYSKPWVPIDEAVAVIVEILTNDTDDLRKRIKLTLADMHKLVESCLSTNYFIFDNRVCILENPIGLALMVVISKAFGRKSSSRSSRNTLEKQNNVCSLDQLNTKKIVWQENGKRPAQLNIAKIFIGGLIGWTQKRFQNCPRYTNV